MYNLEKLEELAGGDKDFIISVLTLFIEEVPSDLQQIEEGINEKDFQKIYQHAHKIKPNVDLVGLEIAFQRILEIEQSAKQENMPEVLEKFEVIQTEVNTAITELKNDFPL